jgi:DNA-binding PadR family transcriptional regulator
MSLPRRSALGVMVLAILAEEPMHAYRIQQVIRQRGKDRVVNVQQRASVYQTIDRLQRLGLVEVHAVDRSNHRPERTLYALTDDGRQAMRTWIADMLAREGREFPEFPVALSFLMVLAPDEALRVLRQRVTALATDLVEIEDNLHQQRAVARLFLIEEEFRRDSVRFELDWTGALVADLESGALTWSEQWVRDQAAAFDAALAEGEPAGDEGTDAR